MRYLMHFTNSHTLARHLRQNENTDYYWKEYTVIHCNIATLTFKSVYGSNNMLIQE